MFARYRSMPPRYTSNDRSNAQHAYLALREDIITCAIAPGQRLKIADLARDFTVSPGAIREALSQLTAEGLVNAEYQRGFRAAPISTVELDDLTRVRVDIEVMALTRSIQAGDRTWLAAVKARYRELHLCELDPTPERSRVHAQFHHSVIAACDSPTLLRIHTSLYEACERYRHIGMKYAAAHRDIVGEHRRIVEAVLARDTREAAAAVSDHIWNTANLVKLALQSMKADDKPG